MYMPVGICKLGLGFSLGTKHRGGRVAWIFFSRVLEAQTPLSEWELGHTASPPKTASAREEIQSLREREQNCAAHQ